MPRHDPAEKTKNEIIKAAARLFGEKGWESVNVEDIVKEVGVTRGAFYHYFKSREELIYAVMIQIFIENNPYTLAMEQEGLNALEKLRFAIKLNHTIQSDPVLVKELQKAFENPVIFKNNLLLNIYQGAPFIEKFITAGNEDGSMSVAFPKQTAQVFLALSSAWLDTDIFPESYNDYADKLAFMEYLCKLLGMPFVDDELREMFLGLHKEHKQK
jgi:AcrR family transcriptional regulator